MAVKYKSGLDKAGASFFAGASRALPSTEAIMRHKRRGRERKEDKQYASTQAQIGRTFELDKETRRNIREDRKSRVAREQAVSDRDEARTHDEGVRKGTREFKAAQFAADRASRLAAAGITAEARKSASKTAAGPGHRRVAEQKRQAQSQQAEDLMAREAEEQKVNRGIGQGPLPGRDFLWRSVTDRFPNLKTVTPSGAQASAGRGSNFAASAAARDQNSSRQSARRRFGDLKKQMGEAMAFNAPRAASAIQVYMEQALQDPRIAADPSVLKDIVDTYMAEAGEDPGDRFEVERYILSYLQQSAALGSQ